MTHHNVKVGVEFMLDTFSKGENLPKQFTMVRFSKVFASGHLRNDLFGKELCLNILQRSNLRKQHLGPIGEIADLASKIPFNYCNIINYMGKFSVSMQGW